MPLYNITYVAKKILWFDEFATVEKQKCHLIPQKFKECLTTVLSNTNAFDGKYHDCYNLLDRFMQCSLWSFPHTDFC